MSQILLLEREPKNNSGWISEVNLFSRATQQSSALSITKASTGLHIFLWKGDDGLLVARCLEIPAAISQGKTRDEALQNIEEALSLVLEDMKEGLQTVSNLSLT